MIQYNDTTNLIYLGLKHTYNIHTVYQGLTFQHFRLILLYNVINASTFLYICMRDIQQEFIMK